MNKKIIALFCVVILMASVFSACGKKLYTQEINGIKQPVVTNESGEIVTDIEGYFAVYVTDASGEKVTLENGEDNTNYVKPPKAIVNPNNTVSTNNFTIKIPDGWFVEENGTLYKKDTDNKCFINATYSTEQTAAVPFDAYIDEIVMQNKKIIESINEGIDEAKKAGYYSAEYKLEDYTFQDYNGYRLFYIIYGDKGQVVHYGENLYFLTTAGSIYSINYFCGDGVGYDKNFNFVEWATNNVSFKEPIPSNDG